MKSYLLLIVFFLSCFFKSQDYPDKIGFLKLGITTKTQFDSIMKIQGFKESICIGKDCYYNKKNLKKNYITIKPDFKEIDNNGFNDIVSENAFSIMVENIKINKYLIPQTELLFYNNILYKIMIKEPPSQLTSDLELKYGEGNFKSNEKDIRCYISDEKLTFTETNYFRRWGNISYLLVDTRAEEGCKPQIRKYIFAETYLPDEAEKEDQINRTKLEILKKDKIKNQLKDL
jgi:NifB/MoaA-like Fe-S oxidoreductase